MMSITTTRTHLGEQFSEGARLLWLAMDDRGWTQGQLRRALEAKSGVVSRWLYGDIKPGLEWAEKILKLLEIPFEAWNKPPVEKFVPPAAREQSDTDGAKPNVDNTNAA